MKKANNDVEYNYDSDFPRILRDLMKERGTTQDALAEICGVKRQSIAQWKDGNTRPDVVSLRKISEFYEVSTDYLLGLTPNPTTDEATKELCKTLGISDDVVYYLHSDNAGVLRDVVNFLFAQHKEYDEFDRVAAFSDFDGPIPELTKEISILKELSEFIRICQLKKDIQISILFGDECKITYYDEQSSETVLKNFDIKADWLNINIEGVSLMEYAATQNIDNIKGVLQFISKQNSFFKTLRMYHTSKGEIYNQASPISEYLKKSYNTNKENT